MIPWTGKRLCIVLILFICCLPNSATAYIGPGAGLSAIGAFLALFMAIIAALFGFLWYPVKRILKKKHPDH